MQKPDALTSGDTVMIVSPASVIDVSLIEWAERVLAGWGLKVVRGKYCEGHCGSFSGTIEERLYDFREALLNPEVKAIICSRGGYGAVHLLSLIDPELINRNPKWMIGFSDISALHAAFLSAGVMSLHASMCKHLTEEPVDHPVTCLIRDILFGTMPGYVVPGHQLNRPGGAEGVLCGGNLAVLCGLLRTPYDIFQRGRILFVEDIAEKPYKLERMFYNLKLSGILKELSGLIVGQFTEYEEDPGLGYTVYEMISDMVKEYDYPVCFGFPAGHVCNNYPLIEGAFVNYSVTNKSVMLNFVGK